MNVEPSRRFTPAVAWRLAVRAAAFAVVAGDAIGQTTEPSAASRVATGAVVRPGLLQAFDRLDPMGMVLIVGAGVILVLLVIRIGMMVLRERPVAMPATRARVRMPGGDGPADRAPLQGSTDWGPDQNARGAMVREPVAVAGAPPDLPSLDQAVTQWTISEVHNAAAVSRQANESMGKPSNLPPSPYRTAFNPYYRGEPSSGDIEVTEVADALQQAELLVQLGDPKQAMTLLSNHIRDTEKPGPAVWLMLLNLYQATGRKSQYEALATGFSTLFNAAVPPWAAKREVAARDIEAYPQVMMKVHLEWGKPQSRATLEGLLNDNRGGSRQGFSLAAYRDILFLLEIVDELDAMTREDEEREGIQRKLGRIA
jgi:hypothetical protein